ncbi:MAG TPA: outer-membrane lipoprotein carrier protein LolA [Blastocatellia bacterium]|nr:outer-membrane lipoprotein carrier protein LolA [Blastocatellia bacterium]
MKRSAFILAIVAVVATMTFMLPTSANGKLDEVLANMERAARSIKTIEADMNQEKRNLQIGGPPERYAGKIYFEHGKACDKVRIEYSVPQGQFVTVLCDKIYLFQARINQCIVTTRQAQASKNQEFSFIATPYKSVPELKRQYNIAYGGDEQVGASSTAKLELTPKGKSSVKKLTLWVDQSSWLPIKYQVVETNNNPTTFTLSGIIKNGKLSGDKFKGGCPAGSKVVPQ